MKKACTTRATKGHEGQCPFCFASIRVSRGESSVCIALERMGAVSAQREDELQENFVAVAVLGVACETVLATDLAEFAGPVGQSGCKSLVGESGQPAPVRPVKTRAGKPAPRKLVVSGSVKPERTLFRRELLSLAPYEFAASHERMIDGTPQRLPSQGRVNAVELSDEVSGRGDGPVVMSARVGKPEIEIGGLSEVFVS